MPMAVTDPQVADNPIIYANAAFLELCGYGRDEVLGQNYFFLVGDRADPGVAARVEAAAMAARREFIEDVPFRAKDGREVWVSLFVSPVIEDGRLVQHFASFLDISDRVARERELRRGQGNAGPSGGGPHAAPPSRPTRGWRRRSSGGSGPRPRCATPSHKDRRISATATS